MRGNTPLAPVIFAKFGKSQPLSPQKVVDATAAMTPEQAAQTRQNLNIPNANVVDDTLSISGAAADAKVVGDIVDAIESGTEGNAEYHLGFYIDAQGYICQKINSDE